MSGTQTMLDKIKSRCQQNKLITAIIAIVVVTALLACWYFFYWTKTPAYSLNIIKESIQKHDLATFNKHVDTQALYDRLYDDYLAYSMEKDGMNNPLAVGLATSFKPMAVNAMIMATNNAVSSGESPSASENDAAGTVLRKTGASHTTFVDVVNTAQTGNSAVVSIKFNDAQVEKDFVIDVKMEKLDDGTWKVVAIENLPDYLSEYDKAKEAKLHELNIPIQEKIDAVASIDKNIRPAISSQTLYTLTTNTLVVPITIKNTSADENVQSLTINTQVTDGTGNVLLNTTSQTDTAIAAGQTVSLTYSHRLNPFIAKEKTIASLGVANINVSFQITEVRTDKETIKLLTDIPE